jgi:hypothetical protein
MWRWEKADQNLNAFFNQELPALPSIRGYVGMDCARTVKGIVLILKNLWTKG